MWRTSPLHTSRNVADDGTAVVAAHIVDSPLVHGIADPDVASGADVLANIAATYTGACGRGSRRRGCVVRGGEDGSHKCRRRSDVEEVHLGAMQLDVEGETRVGERPGVDDDQG